MHTQKEITWTELLAQFDPSVHDALRDVAALPGTTHLVVYENRLLDSSAAGSRTAIGVGPRRTYRSLDEAYGGHLHDPPSRRQYPVAHAAVPA